MHLFSSIEHGNNGKLSRSSTALSVGSGEIGRGISELELWNLSWCTQKV